MVRSVFISIIALFLLSNCFRPRAKESMRNLSQLEGSWSSTKGVLFNENWRVKNDTLLVGIGFSLQGNDTAFKEELKIFLTDGQVFYAAKVGENDQYVTFKLSEAKRNSWVFENHDHDYPNIISYRMVNDELVAATSNSNGNKKIEFVMKRKQ